MSFATGYVYDEERIAAATSRMESAGFQVSFEKDRPTMKDWWEKRKAKGVVIIAAQFAEHQATGTLRDPNNQVKGTCVEQASERAIEDGINSLIARKAVVGKPTRIAGELMYGFERNAHWGKTHPFSCNCGRCPAGLQGTDAAAFYTLHGMIRRDNYASLGIDLTHIREDLSFAWNNNGVPAELLAAAAFHKIQCHQSRSWTEYADALAAEYWGWICMQGVFGIERVILDKFNCVLPDQVGPNYGHCTEASGVVVLPDYTTGFLITNSWGLGPKYPKTIETVNGPLEMRPGQYCVRQSVLEGFGNQVELISCDIPSGSVFR